MTLSRCFVLRTLTLIATFASSVLADRPCAWDMASLYSQSDAVLMVGPFDDIRSTGRVVLASAIVKDVYKGTATSGTTVTIALQDPIPSTTNRVGLATEMTQYATVDSFGAERGSLLFLNAPVHHKGIDYICRIAGAKYVRDKAVLSYVRFSSFGAFVLVVQTPERIELPTDQGYGRNELLKDLSAAMEYAQRFQEISSRRATEDELNAFALDPVEHRRPGVTSPALYP